MVEIGWVIGLSISTWPPLEHLGGASQILLSRTLAWRLPTSPFSFNILWAEGKFFLTPLPPPPIHWNILLWQLCIGLPLCIHARTQDIRTSESRPLPWGQHCRYLCPLRASSPAGAFLLFHQSSSGVCSSRLSLPWVGSHGSLGWRPSQASVLLLVVGGGGWFCGAGLPWMQVGSLLRVSGPPPEGLWLAGSPVLL